MKNRKMRNYLKLGIFLFGISLILWNCQKEEQILETRLETPIKVNAKTVSFEQAKNYFENKQSNIKYLRKGGNSLNVTPNWNSLEHNQISYTDALLTTAETDIDRGGNYSSQLFFIEVNGQMKNVIFTIWEDEVDQNGLVINARVFFNEIDGTFIDGYKIEDGKYTKRLVPKKAKNIQKAGFFMFLFQGSGEDCWNTDTLGDFEGGTLDEVTIWASGDGGTSGGSTPYIGYFSIVNNAVDYGNNIDSSASGGGGSSSNSITSSGITNGAAAILTIPPDEKGECPEGFTKNPTTNLCESNCKDNKIWNATTKKCDCPTDKVEDKNGKCVDKPCKGNPIKGKLEVAPQKGKSKTKGALQGCTRYGGTCTGGKDNRNKTHAGIDIKSSYGNPIYAMYDGFIYSTKFHKKAGYNTRIQSTINGKTILVSYFHLQKENRVLQGTPLVKVKAGDIIGYQGDSGNLKGAIKSGGVESHVHIEVREHDGSSKWGYKNFNLVDPRTYFSTTIKDDGTSETKTNCN